LRTTLRFGFYHAMKPVLWIASLFAAIAIPSLVYAAGDELILFGGKDLSAWKKPTG